MVSRAHLESPQSHAPACLSGFGLLLAPGKQVVPLCPEASPCNYRLAGPGAKCASRHGSLLAASLCLGPVSATRGEELIHERRGSGLSSVPVSTGPWRMSAVSLPGGA